MKTIIMALALSMSALASADTINRCEAPDGRITWTNQPCPADSRVSVVSVQPTVTDSSGLRDWARRSPAARTVAAPAPKRAEAAYINPVECENARRGYAFEAGWRNRQKESLAWRRKEVHRHCGYWP
jgi:hypothetical protein